jgi:aspartate carbamoyltransferase catalytic subunit
MSSSKVLPDLNQFTKSDIYSLFEIADKIQRQKLDFQDNKLISVALLFFESSTRTKASFQMAIRHLGLKILNFDPAKSSISKGESLIDTCKVIEALGAKAIVLRHSLLGISSKLSSSVNIPILNAGEGKASHPTQALSDVYTIWKNKGQLKEEKLLIVGDVFHSRVARSHFTLLPKLGIEVAVCGPSTLVPSVIEKKGIPIFRNLDEGLEWASVVMALRNQIERQHSFLVPNQREFSERFGLNGRRLEKFNKTGLIMHPMPLNLGVEISEEVLKDPRNIILDQVKNGVFVRAALLAKILELSL